MKHYAEKWKSRAPLPSWQKCPTPAGKQITLLPTLDNLPAVSLLLPSRAGLAAGPPPLHWGFLRRVGGNGATGREVKRQRRLDPGSPSWTVGSTHGSRPSGQQACSSCLLSGRKTYGMVHVRPFPYGVSPASSSTVPKPLVGLVSAGFTSFASAHSRVSGMRASKTQVSSLPWFQDPYKPSFPEEEPLPTLEQLRPVTVGTQ